MNIYDNADPNNFAKEEERINSLIKEPGDQTMAVSEPPHQTLIDFSKIIKLLNELKSVNQTTVIYVKQRCVALQPLAELLPVREKVLHSLAVYEVLNSAAAQLNLASAQQNNAQILQRIQLFNFFSKQQLQDVATELLQLHGAKAFMASNEIGNFWQHVHDELKDLFIDDPWYQKLFAEVN